MQIVAGGPYLYRTSSVHWQGVRGNIWDIGKNTSHICIRDCGTLSRSKLWCVNIIFLAIFNIYKKTIWEFCGLYNCKY